LSNRLGPWYAVGAVRSSRLHPGVSFHPSSILTRLDSPLSSDPQLLAE
jgi:hypothetical protein